MQKAVVVAILVSSIGCGGGDRLPAVSNRMALEGASAEATLRGTGAACAYNSQCASGGCSADENGGTCGRCLDLRAIGERCDGPDQSCAARRDYPDEAACNEGVCTRTYTLGHACRLDEKSLDFVGPCADGLYCGGSRCVAITATIPVGGACNSLQLTSEFCAAGSICSSDNVCIADEPRPPVLAKPHHVLRLGETCSVFHGVTHDGDCEAGSVCGNLDYPDGGGGDVRSTCLALPREGQACQHNHCGADLYCTRGSGDPGRCERRPSTGQACKPSWFEQNPCAAGSECRSGVCETACR